MNDADFEMRVRKAMALHEAGDPEAALVVYRQALLDVPAHPIVLFLAGSALFQLDDFESAAIHLKQAVTLEPTNINALNNYANTLQSLGQLDEAETTYQRALDINPDFAEAWNNLGGTLQKTDRIAESTAAFRRAIDLQADYEDAHLNLGIACMMLENWEDAISSFRRTCKLNPLNTKSWTNLGFCLLETGKIIDSIDAYQRVLEIDPHMAIARNGLGVAFKVSGQIEKAVLTFRKCIELDPAFADAHRNYLSTLLYLPQLSQEELFANHLDFARTHTPEALPDTSFPLIVRDPERRLRIGYLSSDFRAHPIGLNLKPVFEAHNHSNFEIFAYADVEKTDTTTQSFGQLADHWRDALGKTDEELAEIVREDKIDILVCLAGHFDRNRPLVCAHRAAPVQVSFHDGATSGLSAMDYWFTDHVLHPENTKERFSEELYRLPVFYQFIPLPYAPEISPLPVEEKGFITFGSFNSPKKINQDVIDLWADILKAVPESRLVLKYRSLFSDPALHTAWIKRFTDLDISAERVFFYGEDESGKEHLDHYADIDIALDPFPFTGATTTFEALWMGVPIISMMGDNFASRMAGSILHHAGHPDLTVTTPAEYIARACELADDRPKLKDLRATLRGTLSASRLCDGKGYTRTIEDAYRDMWEKFCENQASAGQ